LLRTELLLGRFRLQGVVATVGGGELIRARSSAGDEVLLHLFRSREEAGRESARLELLTTLGIPKPRAALAGERGAAAVVLAGLAGAVPISAEPRVPPPALRPALGRLLSALSHAHSRGLVHGAVSADSVLVAPDGGFWLVGWGAARPVRDCEEEVPRRAGIAQDLRDLGRVFGGVLESLDAADGSQPGLGVSPDLLRIVEHMAAQEAREAYRNAAEVLADLGLPDESIADAWEAVPHVGRVAPVGRVMRLIDDLCKPYDEGVLHTASVDLVGPAGCGKSRLLREVADAARARGAVVLSARGDVDPGWGGVGALLRQVMRLLPASEAEEDRGLHDLVQILDRRPTPQSRATLLDERAAGAVCEAATSAATGMIRSVFERRLGVLLLDDADRATPSAISLWRAVGRFVHAMNDSGAGIQIVLVAAMREAPEAPESGVVRDRFEFSDWTPAEVSQFLDQVLVRADLEPSLSARVHRDLGGRPGDVVAYLRDLESEGYLAREGVRWRIRRPPPEPAAWAASGQREALRAAIERCGSDGRALLEVVAVAGDAEPERERCAALAGVSGPRLHRGADAAIREGLLVRHGATWRPRSGSIRLRVLAAMPSGRRATLHREFLVQLQRVADPAPERVAPHARGCVDRTAGDWTHRAIAALRERRRFEEAIQHVEDARTHLHADPYWTLEGRLLFADLLRLAGRLGDAIREYETYVADPRAAPLPSAHACLSLAEALYEAREWDRVIAIPLPIEGGTPQTLCHIRLLRAGAHCRMRDLSQSGRERRLAAGELGSLGVTPALCLARIELDYLGCMANGDLPGAREAATAAILLSKRHGDLAALGRMLGTYANVVRVMGRPDHAAAVVDVSDRLLRRVGPRAFAGHARNQVTRAALLSSRRDHSAALECLEVGRLMTMRAGARSYAEQIELRACNESFSIGVVGVARFRTYVAAIGSISSWPAGRLIECGFVLCALNANFSNLSAAIRLDELTSGLGPKVRLKRRTVAIRLMLEYWRFSAVVPESADAAQREACRLEELLDPVQRSAPRNRFSIHGSGLSVAARMIRSGQWLGDPTWPRVWTLAALVDALRSPVPGWGGIDLAVALALWAPVEFDAELWDELVAVLRGQDEWPWALHWQVHFVIATDARLRGDLDRSRLAAGEALRSFETLRRLDPGCLAETQSFEELRARFSTIPARSGAPAVAPVTEKTASSGVAAVFRSVWGKPLDLMSQHRHCALLSGSLRELELFLDAATAVGESVRVACSADLRSAASRPQAAIALMAPNLWPAADLRETLPAIRSWGLAHRRVITCITEPRDQFCHKSPEHWALSEATSGRVIRVCPLFQPEALRSEVIGALAERVSPVPFDPAVLWLLADDASWLGAREVERVITACATATSGHGTVTVDVLTSSGYRRPRASEDRLSAELVRHIQLSSTGCGVGDLTRITGASRRTTQRRLRDLVAAGRLLRVGAGRASRYFRSSEGRRSPGGGP
jgi:AAA ATPase-like protein